MTDCCSNRTRGGTCRCVPKCLRCGFGPHAAIHFEFSGRDPGKPPHFHAYATRVQMKAPAVERQAPKSDEPCQVNDWCALPNGHSDGCLDCIDIKQLPQSSVPEQWLPSASDQEDRQP